MSPAPHRRPARIRQPLAQRTRELRREMAEIEHLLVLQRERDEPTRKGWQVLTDCWPWLRVAAAPALERRTVEEIAPDPGIAFARLWNACEGRGPG